MFFAVFASIVVWSLVIVVAMRVFNNCGFSFPKNKVTDFLLAEKRITLKEETDGKELLYLFLACIAFRIAVYIISVFPVALFTNDQSLDFPSWLAQWKQWDATGYNHMIQGGYKYMMEDGEYVTLVFFPLYSFAGRILNIFINNTQLSAIITSTLCYAFACCFLYKLVIIDYGKSVARKAVLYISISPFGFYFGAMLTESMFFLTTVASFYYIRKHNWIMVGVCGALAALSRISGVVVIFPAVVEFIEHYRLFGMFKDKKVKEAFKLILTKGLWIFGAFVGVFIYLYCNYSLTGDWFKFLELQHKFWGEETCYFGKCILIMWQQIVSDRSIMVKFGMFIPELLSVIMMLITMLYGARRHKSMYITYMVVYLVMNTSITWPISIARYMLCALPMFIVLADFTERHKKAHIPITVVSAIFFGIYMTGYLFSKQIM